MPSLLQIQLFVAVVEEQSFTMAAEREQLSQSGVSQHVSHLEERLGVQLLKRQRTVSPTPAGEVYYRRCIDLLRAHAAARSTLEQLSHELTGTLQVGLVPSLTRAALAPALLAFKAAHPQVIIKVTEAYGAVLNEQLRHGRLDLTVAPPASAGHPGLTSKLFLKSPAFLVSSKNSKRSHCEPVRLQELKGLKLVLPASSHARRARLERYLTGQGIRLAARMELDSILGTMDLVRTSDWVTIMPGLFVAPDIASGQFTLNPLVNPALLDEMMLFEQARHPASEAGQAFIAALRRATDEINTLPTRLIQGIAITPPPSTDRPARGPAA